MRLERNFSQLDERVERLNQAHQTLPARDLLSAAISDLQLAPIAMVSSFGAESVVLLHMLSKIQPSLPILFLDTEMHFPETLKYQEELAQHLGLKDVRIIQPDRGVMMEKDPDSLLHLYEPDACCTLRKTEPLHWALRGFDTWITGRKRMHGGERATLNPFENDGDLRIKINPLYRFSKVEIARHLEEYNLPRHPLVKGGFRSIGCAPCTTKTAEGENPRAGRWRGQSKTRDMR